MENYGTGAISVTYDPAVVHVASVSSGPDSTAVAWNINNTTGIVTISAWNIGGVSGDIVFANVTFKAVRTGSTPLNISVTTLKDIFQQDITAIIKNGSFTIEAEQFLIPFLISGHVFYENGSKCSNPHVNITNLNTSDEWQAETSPTSNYYQLVLRYGIDIIASEVLQFNVTSPDGKPSNITNYTITQDDINNGGLFNFKFDQNRFASNFLSGITGIAAPVSTRASFSFSLTSSGSKNLRLANSSSTKFFIFHFLSFTTTSFPHISFLIFWHDHRDHHNRN